ncbi:hypothetical protein YPPY90_1154, partial [Yersinia pestis PY-90]
MNGEDRQK